MSVTESGVDGSGAMNSTEKYAIEHRCHLDNSLSDIVHVQ